MNKTIVEEQINLQWIQWHAQICTAEQAREQF